MINLPDYQDHAGLYRDELRDWLPGTVFDSHVHLGPPEAVGDVPPPREKEALTTFSSLTWERAQAYYAELFAGKTIAGLVAFGFPLRETDLDAANDYIAELMRRAPLVHGFIVSDPHDTARTVRQFEAVRRRGPGFVGIKPYYDLLAKPARGSCLECRCEEFVPDDLLGFADRERLAIMLHTGGIGVGADHVQAFVRKVATRFPRAKLILAHMGRYLEPEQFLEFFRTDLLDFPNVWLEMSSATSPTVYEACLSRRDLWDRILFGTDLPYGLITGTEHWSDEHGPIFVTRDDYPWSDPALNDKFAHLRDRLTFNTYHTIKAFKDACDVLGLGDKELGELKSRVFLENARSLFPPRDATSNAAAQRGGHALA